MAESKVKQEKVRLCKGSFTFFDVWKCAQPSSALQVFVLLGFAYQ